MRLKNTSMPTRDMERFVELSHREEEDEEDMQAGGGGGGDGAMYNTTNNNNSVGSFETNGNADRRMMEHSKSHPRMLKSNATSHVWPLGALAELLDNSQDRECGSRKVEVDAYVLNPSRDKDGYCITVQDDGVGMDRARLNNMLSFGFSDKEHLSGNVGRFGIGFKSGSMRLADDALILTKREGMAHCAMLSQTFLDAIGADDIFDPNVFVEDGRWWQIRRVRADGCDGVVLKHGDY
jgi:hypothetical protein